jgi:hypothetical protein
MKKRFGKMDLAALEKQLILLEEEQKSSILGGSYYYENSTGFFLGQAGSGDQVRFISLNDWKFNALPYNNGNLGTDFSNATDSTREKFFLNQLPSNVGSIEIKNVTGLSSYDAIAGIVTTDSYDSDAATTFVYKTDDPIYGTTIMI